MEPSLSHAFRRTFAFTRTQQGNGFLAWPTITFKLTDGADGHDIGQLSLRGKRVTYASATDVKEDFCLKRNFWGTRWTYEGDDEQEFGRYRMGWSFRPSFVFRGGERILMKATRRWPFRRKKPGRATQTATFFREETPVMELKSFTPTPFFYNEVTANMEGTIGTDLADIRMIAGLLILFQAFLEMRNRSAH